MIHARTEIVDSAQKHLHPSSSRPCGCWDIPAYTASKFLYARISGILGQPTFQTLKQTVLKGRPSCATAPENHATRSTGAGLHTSGLWSAYHVHYMENLGDNKDPNAF